MTQLATVPTRQKTSPPPGHGVLQRQCACGQHTGNGGECETCKKKSLQRKPATWAEAGSVPSTVHEVLRSPGQPLNGVTRAFMEPRFGQDFSQVRNHSTLHQGTGSTPIPILQRSPDAPENQMTLPYQEAMEATEQGTYQDYVRDCQDARVLHRLSREEPIPPAEKARRLEDRIKFIQHYFGSGLSTAKDPITRLTMRCVIDCIFGPDYALSTEESEIASTQCELSEARWQSMALAHRGRIPGRRGLHPDLVPWVPDPRVCFNPDRMAELRDNITAGKGCDAGASSNEVEKQKAEF